MSLVILNGTVVTDGTTTPASVRIEGDRIVAVGAATAADAVIDASGCYVVPGFVDLHVHGGGGHDFMEATPVAFAAVTSYHLAHGATSQVPTIATATADATVRFLEAYRAAATSPHVHARLVGAHLEGPYLSPRKAGAHVPALLRLPDPAEYEPLVRRYPFLRRITAAPELPGAFALGDFLAAHGVNASIGHSDATADVALAAADHGFTSVTHLYNAMSSVGERDGRKQGGVLEAALLDDRLYTEIIADLRHVPPELLRLAVRVKGKERLALVSDCLAPAGMPEGTYTLGAGEGATAIEVRDAAYVAGTGKLAGSVIAADGLLRNMVGLGIPLPDAVWMLTRTPAELLGLGAVIGAIAPGRAADVVVLDSRLAVRHVVCRGVLIH